MVIASQYASATSYWELSILNTTGTYSIQFLFYNGSARTVTVNSTGLLINTWYHILMAKDGNDYYFFQDGTLQGTKQTNTNSVLAVAGGVQIGGINAGSLFNGWFDEVKLSQGSARYVADFTPPTSAYAKTTSLLEITTSPYLEAELLAVHVAQNNDVMYMTHPNWQSRKLTRLTATTFSLATVSFVRGPFLDDNITAVTIDASKDTKAEADPITLTASAGDIFHYDSTLGAAAQLLVGSLFRVKSGVVKIVTVASATSATASVQDEPDGTPGDLHVDDSQPTDDWAEGAFSDYRGWPATCGFHEQRLYYAQTEYEPNKFWGSVIQAYDNFDVGTTADDDAVTFAVAAEQRSEIRWMMSNNKSINLGTNGGTFSGPTGDGFPIAPTNPPTLSKDTNYGVSTLAAKRISSYLYYVQRDLLKVRELSYSLDLDAQHSQDMTILADHILKDGSGVIDMDHQQSPNDRLWCVRSDGVLAVLTRNPEQEVMGWSRLIAGSDLRGAGVYESVCVIPKSGQADQVWVIVKRYINNSIVRYIEYFTLEDFDEDWDAVNVDCSLTLDSPKTITAMTNGSPGVFTSVAHGFTGGEQVKINGVVLADLSGVASTEINGTYLLVYIGVDTFSLTTVTPVVAVNTTSGNGYGEYVSSGEVRKMVTEIFGLSHLEGETVSVQADGLALDDTYTVDDGKITLVDKAAVVHVGLPYEGTIQLLKLSDGSATGTGQTKVRRIYLGTVRVYRSLGMKIGKTESTLNTVYFGATNDPASQPSALVTGDIEKFFQTWWAKDDEIIIRQDTPSPLNILSIILLSEVEDK
jgi:hypothetical protein